MPSAFTAGNGSLNLANVMPNTAIASDSDGNLISSSTTDVELDYLQGATSNIQTQINALGTAPIAASNAEMEAASSTTVYVTPGRQQKHPSSPKVWAVYSSETVATLFASFNVTSITDNGVGDITTTFTVPFSSTLYSISGSGQMNSVGAYVMFMQWTNPASGQVAPLAGSARCGTVTPIGIAPVDTTGVCLQAFGDQ